MTYLPGQPQGQNNAGVARQNDPRNDPRAYQYRPIMPNLRVEPPITQAPTFGQYVRSDFRGVPGAKRPKWAGRIAFWLGIAAAAIFYLGAGAIGILTLIPVAMAVGAVAFFFGLVAFVAGIGRGLGFWGMLLAVVSNLYVFQWLVSVFA